MRTSDSIAKLAAALSKAQGELPNAAKDHENPHFKSKYADLAAVRDVARPVLAKYGLSVVQLPMPTDAGVVLQTRLLHDSGEFIEGELPLVTQGIGMQGVMSALTYGRRAMLQSVLGIAADDDDDGEAAQGRDGSKPTAVAKGRDRAPRAANPSSPSTPTPSAGQGRAVPSASPPPGPEVLAARGARLISDSQRTRLWTVARKSEWSDEDVKSLLTHFGYDSSKSIAVSDYDRIVEAIQTGTLPDAEVEAT